MVATVLNTAARHGDEPLFDRMRAAAKQEKDEDIQWKLLSALGLFQQPEIAKAGFYILLSDEFNVRQPISILSVAHNSPKTRDLAYDFVKQNWDALMGKFPTNWEAFMPFVANSFCDEQHRHDAADFNTKSRRCQRAQVRVIPSRPG